MNKYLKLFFSSGIYFGLCMGAFFSFQQESLVSGFITGLSSGVFFGLGISIFTYFSDKKMKEKGMSTDSVSPIQFCSVMVRSPKPELINHCEAALLSVKKSKLLPSVAEGYSLSSKVGLNWKSFGEKMELKVEELEEGSLITIKSSPIIFTTMFDYGKNYENVRTVANYFAKNFNAQIKETHNK